MLRVVSGLLTAALLPALLSLVPASGAAAPGQRTAPDHRAATFHLGTFNILGSQHTEGSRTWKSGKARARITSRVIDGTGIDLIGMQEVQADQLRVLQRRLTRHAVWPGDRLGGNGLRLQIAWRKAKFRLLKAHRISTRFDRQRRPIPYVLLEHRASGRKLYVVNVHNSPRGLEEERDSATRHQIRLVRELRATGRSVFVVGDMNEHAEAFCKFVGWGGLGAANGGRASSVRDCDPPSGRLRIDWIFGAGPFEFRDYRHDDSRRVQRASDHVLVRTAVRMRPRKG